MQIGFHNFAAFNNVEIEILTKRYFVFIFELYFRCFFSFVSCLFLRVFGKFFCRFHNFWCYFSCLFLGIFKRLRSKFHNVNKIIVIFVVFLPEIFFCHIYKFILRAFEPKIICEKIDIVTGLVFIQYCIYEKFSSEDLPIDFIWLKLVEENWWVVTIFNDVQALVIYFARWFLKFLHCCKYNIFVTFLKLDHSWIWPMDLSFRITFV